MKLYHYTSLDSFLWIWQSQRLLFSKSHKTTNNDLFEKCKWFTITGDAMSVKKEAWKKFSDNIDTFLQISLTRDYKDCEGCLSPMMWGQYADNGNGVCIELDSEKLELSNNNIWGSKIKYLPCQPEVRVDANIVNNSSMHFSFIKAHKREIFFRKHKHWRNENEFRFISNVEKHLMISDAALRVYVPSSQGHTSYVVRKVVGNDIPVSYITSIPYNGYMKLIAVSF